MTIEDKKITIGRYGVAVASYQPNEDLYVHGLSNDLLSLANSWLKDVNQGAELHRSIPIGELFFYNIEQFDDQKVPKRKLLRAEIGIGSLYRDEKKILRLERVRPIKRYTIEDGWLQKNAPSKFRKGKHVIISTCNPIKDTTLFLIPNSVICSHGNGLPEVVPLKNDQVLGMVNDDVRSVALQELLYNEEHALVTKSNHFELEAKDSTVHSNAIHLKSQRSRPLNPQPGTIIFNNRKKSFEGWDGTSWKTLKMED